MNQPAGLREAAEEALGALCNLGARVLERETAKSLTMTDLGDALVRGEAAINALRAALAQPDEESAPLHPFELRIVIGGEDWDYVVRTITRLAEHIPAHGPTCGLYSGGGGGSHSVDVQTRDVSIGQFRDELQAWRKRIAEARKVLNSKPGK